MKKIIYIYIQILKNGYPIVNYKKNIKDVKYIDIGENAKLNIPSYNIPKINLFYYKKNKFSIIKRSYFEGFVKKNNTIKNINCFNEDDIEIKENDIGHIRLYGLILNFKILKENNIKNYSINRNHKINFNAKDIMSFISYLLSSLLFVTLMFILFNNINRKKNKNYILPFIYEKNILLANEFLQKEINIKDFEINLVDYFKVFVEHYFFNSIKTKNIWPYITEKYNKINKSLNKKYEISNINFNTYIVTGDSFNDRLINLLKDLSIFRRSLLINLNDRKKFNHEFILDKNYNKKSYTKKKLSETTTIDFYINSLIKNIHKQKSKNYIPDKKVIYKLD